MPGVSNDTRTLQHRGGLAAVRSVLTGLVLVGFLGIVGALASYRADVGEARRQVQERVSRQCRLYADSLALHFDVLRAELQRLGDQPLHRLRAPDDALRTLINDDRNLFAGGVALLDGSGRLLWSEPHDALRGDLARAIWFQRVLATGKPAVDGLTDEDSSRIAVALPVREGNVLSGVLVGIMIASDRLIYGVDPGEELLILSSSERVLLPLSEPAWSRRPGFAARVDELLKHDGDTEAFSLAGASVVAHAATVRGTSLEVLNLETEAAAIAPVRRRLNLQLAFLLLLQLAAVGAFTLFLRRTWRTFQEVEARVAQQEKMAALGTASSLIAHEVKNSLNGLKAAASLLESGGDASLAIKTMRGQVERLAHLARSLLSFARPDETRLTRVDLSAVVRETVQALASLPEAGEANVELELPPELPVASDPLLVATAVDNLVRNAIEATVAAKDMGTSSSNVVAVRARREGNVAVVTVEDAAGGPPGDFEEHVGEPFVTSKPRGIGLGLTMTRRAAEQLGGELVFHRTVRGSRFELRLPVR